MGLDGGDEPGITASERVVGDLAGTTRGTGVDGPVEGGPASAALAEPRCLESVGDDPTHGLDHVRSHGPSEYIGPPTGPEVKTARQRLDFRTAVCRASDSIQRPDLSTVRALSSLTVFLSAHTDGSHMETEAAIRYGTMQATALLLIAGGLLIALGVAGVGASLPLVGGLVLLSIGLYLTRPDEGRIGRIAGVDVDAVLGALWLAVLVAAVPLLLEPSATPEEVQALGGLLGLAGMANYFLRPVYLVVYDVVSSLVGGERERVNGR